MTMPLPGMGPTMPCPECGGTGTVPFVSPTTPTPGAVGRKHPGTSRAVAFNPFTIPQFGKQRHRCMLVLRPVYPDGLTAAEIAERVSIVRNQTATRLQELRDGGFVEYLTDDDGRIVERPTGPHADGQVQRLTRKGMTTLVEMDRRRGEIVRSRGCIPVYGMPYYKRDRDTDFLPPRDRQVRSVGCRVRLVPVGRQQEGGFHGCRCRPGRRGGCRRRVRHGFPVRGGRMSAEFIYFDGTFYMEREPEVSKILFDSTGGSIPAPFPGTAEEVAANRATHREDSWDPDEPGRCTFCDCRPYLTSGEWPCDFPTPGVNRVPRIPWGADADFLACAAGLATPIESLLAEAVAEWEARKA